MSVSFVKMSGAGNDFIVIDNRSGVVQRAEEFAVKWCDRHWGIGADGLLLLEKSERADFRMMYYNADGSYGGMCGNGGRCIARFAFSAGIARDAMRFEALDHVYEASISGDRVALKMKDPATIAINVMLPMPGGPLKVHYVDTGAPHVVIARKDLPGDIPFKSLDMVELGRRIRYHDRFAPGGTNVNVVEIDADQRLRIRTYERGVEAETLACGTGSVAASIVAVKAGLARSPVDVIVASGAVLNVEFAEVDGELRNVQLTGPAIETFRGVIG